MVESPFVEEGGLGEEGGDGSGYSTADELVMEDVDTAAGVSEHDHLQQQGPQGPQIQQGPEIQQEPQIKQELHGQQEPQIQQGPQIQLGPQIQQGPREPQIQGPEAREGIEPEQSSMEAEEFQDDYVDWSGGESSDFDRVSALDNLYPNL